MDCKLMLQSAFDWAKKGTLGGAVEFPEYAKVFATVTIHHSIDRSDKRSDVVWYANGSLRLSAKDGQEVLTGNIPARINKTEYIFIPPQPGDLLGNSIPDLFPDQPDLQLLLTVTSTGTITVGKLIKEKLIGGFPPSTFQGTCENELLTGRVDVLGQAVCTVSFSLGSGIGLP